MQAFGATRTGVLILLLLALPACSHPTDKALSAFADSTGAITSIAASASDLQADIDYRSNVVQAGVGYSERGAGRWVFPPPESSYVDKQMKRDWAARVALLKAIGAYAKALSEANDPALSKSVGDTTASLAGALAGLQGAIDPADKSAGTRTQLIGGIVADAAAVVAEAYSAYQIREIMRQAHPKIMLARDLINRDLHTVYDGLRAQRNRYQTNLAKRLELHGADPELSTLDKYNVYVSAAGDVEALNVKIDLVQASADAMDKMVAAHEELMNSSDDTRQVLAFVTLVQGISDKAKQLRDLRS